MTFDASSLEFAHAHRDPRSQALPATLAPQQRPGRDPLSLVSRELGLANAASLELARAHRAQARAQVSAYAAHALDEGSRSLERARREFQLTRYRCSTMLQPGEYDMVLVDAPNVPRDEMRSALRWKIKDMVSYPVEAATVDFLEVPQEEASAAPRQVYAVVARNDLIESRARQFEEAGIPLLAIEIPETAQRNVAALYEADERGVALAYFGRHGGLLTISRGGELYGSRRLEVRLEELADEPEDGEAHERVALEIQRTLDHFERQFRHVAVGRLLLAPQGAPTGLYELLRARLAMPVVQVNLAEVLAFRAAPPDEPMQWRLFHHFGAALREGPS